MGTLTIPLVFGPFLDGFLVGVIVTIFFLFLVPLTVVCCYRKICKRVPDHYSAVERNAGVPSKDAEGFNMKVFSKHSDLTLVKDFIMDADQFQHSWNQWLVSGEYRMYVTGEEHIEEILMAHRITCLASGNPEGYSKYYLYAQDSQKHVYLVEMTIKDKQLSAVFKSDSPASTPKFVTIFSDSLRRLSPL